MTGRRENLTIEPSSILSESLLYLCLFIPLHFAGYDLSLIQNSKPAGTSVSEANMQSCQFVLVGSADIKRKIRLAA